MGAHLMDRLERVVAEWAGREAQRQARRLRRESLARDDERSPARALAEAEFARLLAAPASQRLALLDQRGWKEEGVFLGCLLLDRAESLPLAARVDFARLAARVSALSEVDLDSAFASLLDDNLGRAGLMEVRALRNKGELGPARALFRQLEESFEIEASPRALWLTLTADRALTAGLLALDEYRLPAAERHFEVASRCLRVAGTEEEDAVLLFARSRADLLRSQPEEAVDRLVRAPAFETPAVRLAALELLVRAALFTGRPALARPPLAALTNERGRTASADGAGRLAIFEAAARVLEGQPAQALELLAGPRKRLETEGSLVGALLAAVVAARAELALRRKSRAQLALRSGVPDQFCDLPATPGVSEALAEITTRASHQGVDSAFLDRVDSWLLVVEDSPGVGMAPQA